MQNITVYKIYPVGFAANSYLLTADNKTAVAIDPAQPRIAEEAKRRGLCVQYALLTHGHFDHIGGVGALFSNGAKVVCHRDEVALALGKDNLAESMGGMEIAPFAVDMTVKNGDVLNLCGMKIKVIATPGHTRGGVCYLVGENLFTGDTMFEGSYGRYDLPLGDASDLMRSLKKLCALECDYKIYAGHGEDSTLFREKVYYGA